MDKKQSQKTFVKQELAKHGFITRNDTLFANCKLEISI